MSQQSLEQNADGTWAITYSADHGGVVGFRSTPNTTRGGAPPTAAVNKSGWSLAPHINDRWKSVTESTGACTTR